MRFTAETFQDLGNGQAIADRANEKLGNWLKSYNLGSNDPVLNRRYRQMLVAALSECHRGLAALERAVAKLTEENALLVEEIQRLDPTLKEAK